MTPEEYNHLVELRNNCYRDRVCSETDITYFTGFNDGYEKGKEIFEMENAELKNRDCWKSCEYANPKAELIEQHIKDVQNLTKAKKLLKKFISAYITYADSFDDRDNELVADAENFLKESEVEK